MNFQELVDSMAAMTCVISVEKRENGYGKIRIVAGNRAYMDSIERPQEGAAMLTTKFVPNSEYTDYLTQDLNFEEYCYEAAVHKRCLHAYAHPERIPFWFNMTFLPVNADDGDLCYCTYTMEMNAAADSGRMSNLAGDLAAKVLGISISLHANQDFEVAMRIVVGDIRKMCMAKYCCVMLMDEVQRSCSVLAEDIAEGSDFLPMEQYLTESFYDIAESWMDIIAGSNCIIAKNDYEMETIRKRNPMWHESLASANVKTIALFPLKVKNQLFGYIWVAGFDSANAIRIKETLEVTVFILASEIANVHMMERLKIMGSRDMLTGVMNRNEMNRVMRTMSAGRIGEGDGRAAHAEGTDRAKDKDSAGEDVPIGVIFADLNGLKEVNDSGGHSAGDALLKDAVSALREVFDADDVYRAGGDEFVIFMKGATESDVLEKVAAIRSAAARYDNLSFAIGTCVEASCTEVQRALRLADERMYEDKRAFYQHQPDPTRYTTTSAFH